MCLQASLGSLAAITGSLYGSGAEFTVVDPP